LPAYVLIAIGTDAGSLLYRTFERELLPLGRFTAD
jgi:hypothetical protein